MNYGYDAQGNRVRRDGGVDSENEEEHVPVAPDHTGVVSEEEEVGDEGQNSDFSDDVELVIGETGNQPVDQPLVESVNLSRDGRHRRELESFLQLEVGPSGREQQQHRGPLLVGDKAADPSTGGVGAQRRRAEAFLDAVAKVPGRVKTVALAGTLHHGKTTLLEMLLGGQGYPRRQDEEGRKISLKAHVVSALVRGSQLCKTTNLVTFVDTPGHPDFAGEINAGLRLADAVVFCVDALESLDANGERLLRQIVVEEQLPIILVVTKVDRLILDLKLPPLDAYRKLRFVVEAVNNVIATVGASEFLVCPENGTVLFASSTLGFIFSLETFALKYAGMYKEGVVDFAHLAQKLWGQVTFEQGIFKKITTFRQRPSFVSFVLEPLYKIVAHSVSGKGSERLSSQLSRLPRSPATAMQEAIRLFLGNPSGEGIDALLNVLPAASHHRTATLCSRYHLTQRDSSVFALPSTEDETSLQKGADSSSTADRSAVAAVAPLVCVFTATSDVTGSATGRTRKQHRTALVLRVLSGVLTSNPLPNAAAGSKKKRKSAGAAASPSAPPAFVSIDERSDDVSPFHETRLHRMFVRTVDKGFVEVAAAYPGQVVYATLDDSHGSSSSAEEEGRAALPGGAHASKHLVLLGGRIAKTLLQSQEAGGDGANAEAISGGEEEEAYAAEVGRWLRDVRPWPFAYLGHEPIVHVSLELKDPAELPTFSAGLDLLRRTTPGLDLRTEESGEFTMTGFGELHLDTALHQLRTVLCAGVPIGLSQPFVSFSETVLDAEGALAVAGTRAKGSIGCTSGVLPRALTQAVEAGQIDFFPSGQEQRERLRARMQEEFGFDALDAQNVIALGPDKSSGPSLLFDDTLDEERQPGEKPLTQPQRNAIIAGFRDAMRSGPLTGETVRGVGVKLIFTEPATDKSVRVNELRTNTRLAVRRSLFGARPRLLEPVLAAEILCPEECRAKITSILQQRRGAVLGEEAIPATTLTRVRALVPAMDSFGLETQIRMMTYGQAYPMFTFGQWDVVPGDPYDASVRVGPLEPAKGYQLSRDFVLKTRFRKGLSQELTADI